MERKDKAVREPGQEAQYLKTRNSRKRKRTNHPQNLRFIQENVPKLINKSIQAERSHKVPSTMEEHRATPSQAYWRILGQATLEGQQVLQRELGI